jgi:hypothetical protein
MSGNGQQKVLARLEGENVEETIEVIAGEDNPPFLEIRSLRWGRGNGWYVQKTITLDATQAKMLMRALRGCVVMGAKKTGNGNVIPFPGRRNNDRDASARLL